MLRLVARSSRAALRCSAAPAGVLAGAGRPLAAARAYGRTAAARSDSDFDPVVKKAPADEAEAHALIKSQVANEPVFLYMKGNPASPMCGFSAQVVRILDAMGVEYGSANVLSDPALREGVKSFSAWPTIPQVYVGGEFIGGCDVVTEMFQSGELTDVLKEAGAKYGEAP